MSFAESLTTFLEANATIVAQLESAEVIFPELLPQKHAGFPALTYEITNEENIFDIEGSANELAFATIRLSVWDRSYLTVNSVAAVINTELNGYRGTFGSHTAELIRKENGFTSAKEPDTGLNRYVLDFRVAYY